ncbi:MAG: metal-dependent hydrolase [candidate division WOR-3 bacterium]
MATTVKWLGHATFLIQTPGNKVILIDPWVQGNPACPDTEKAIQRIDLMLITHGHGDHMSDAVPLAKQHRPVVMAIYEIVQYLARHGVENLRPMNKGGSQAWEGITVTMVNAFHSSGIEEGDRIVEGGDPAGFVVKLEDGFSFYHAGDTCLFGDMKWIGELYTPRLAMLPIGDLFTMSPREAAYAIRLLGVRQVIPMHYGTFPLLTGTPAELRNYTEGIPDLQIIELRPGESATFE